MFELAIFGLSGVGNTIPPHVTHPSVTDAESEGRPLTVSVAAVITGGSAHTAVAEIFDHATNQSVGVSKPVTGAAGNVTFAVPIKAAKLWSPESRSLYTAVVTLSDAGSAAPSDVATTRFGIRTIKTDGFKFMINGRRLFLSGYGDDAIYPKTVSAPRDRAGYEAKVEFATKHGFNFVRHHSHTLPPE